MPILDLITIVCVGLMTGNELAVSAFVNPTLWKLDESSQAKALSLLARSLGRVMPFWYVLSLALLIAEAYIRRHDAHPHSLHGAVSIWIFAIVYTVTLLVPINNRIARLDSASVFPNWQKEHAKWDALHRWRILMLAVAMVCLVRSIVSRS
jgi:uncharacterized membrane protein